MTPLDEHAPTPDERAASEALRALPRPEAAPAFRARLKHGFTSGALAERPSTPVIRLPIWRRPGFWPALAAAAAVLLFVAGPLNRGPAWRVVTSRGEGLAIVNGRPIAMAHGVEIGAELARGGRVRIPDDAVLELVASGEIAVRLSAGADADLPAPPNRWFNRSSHARMRHGDLFATTGHAFRGARLVVETDLARVFVTGTSFAVLAHEEGTCVCVMSGTVHVAAQAGPMEVVPPGERCFVYPDRRVPSHHPVLDSSLHALHDLSAAVKDELGR